VTALVADCTCTPQLPQQKLHAGRMQARTTGCAPAGVLSYLPRLLQCVLLLVLVQQPSFPCMACQHTSAPLALLPPETDRRLSWLTAS
jgi:hypothetical protein